LMRRAAARTLASSLVSGSLVALARRSGNWSAAPVGSKRSSGGRRGLKKYWAFGMRGTKPSAAILRVGYFCVCLGSDSR
jgi:hypothetical protein